MGFIVHDRKRHWPNPVPYRIHKSVYSTPGATTKLHKAITAWNLVSPLELVPDKSQTATDYITFEALEDGGGGGSSSSVGKAGGQQWVRGDYDLDGAEITNLLLHEIGHAVGLIHEHQRPDRDAYITTHRVPTWDKGKLGNIQVATGQAVGPYDCEALMHYLDVDAFLDPKPGRCLALSNTKGLSDGDIAALSYLAGERYRILRPGKWPVGRSHIVPFEYNHREYLLTYRRAGTQPSRAAGQARFERVDDGGRNTTNWGKATWAATWDVVVTFELGPQRFLLVYERKSGRVRIDRIVIDEAAQKIHSENVWEGGWSHTWRQVTSLGLEGYQRDHILVYDPGTGVARLDAVNRGETPGLGTVNVWERKWRAGLTSVMPFRLGETDWFVLVYHKGDGKGAVYHLTKSGYKKVQNLDWDKGWTHFVPYPQHSEYSYPKGAGSKSSARFVAYRSTDGAVHFDRFFKNRVEILGTDTWSKGWDILTPYFRGEAGRFHLGNEGLIVYEAGTGLIHFDQLL